MNDEPMMENESNKSQSLETGPATIEHKAENKEVHLEKGVEILENPPDGSFIMGLQTFVAWVTDLFAKGK